MANIKKGMSGDDVRDLQQKLIDAGYDVGSTGADGKFGANTQAAVEAYQRDHGLSVDGIAGVNTMGSLNSQGSSSVSPNVSAGTETIGYVPATGPGGGPAKWAWEAETYYDAPSPNKTQREPFETSAITDDYLDQLQSIAEYGSFEQSQKAKDILSQLEGMKWDKEFSASAKTNDLYSQLVNIAEYGSFEQSQQAQDLLEQINGMKWDKEFSTSEKTNDLSSRLDGMKWDKEFSASEGTEGYKSKLEDVENSKPGSYESRYAGQIDSVLQTILNAKDFDINSDGNYASLYDKYKEVYTQNGQKAMRDAMGSAAGLTGGYGNSYASIAGQQAYDSYMDQLNARNVDLMSLAYGMYQDKQNAQRQNLATLQGLDESDYARYTDDYNKWLEDRGYYAGRYDTSLANDQNAYNRLYQQFLNERDYLANRYDTQYAKDLAEYQQKYSEYADNRDYLTNRYDAQYAKDLAEYQQGYSQYADNRDFLANLYESQYAKDLAEYQQGYSQFADNRDFLANRYDAQYAKDLAEYQQGYSQYADNRDFLANMYNQSYNNDLGRYQYDNNYDFNAETDARDFNYQVARDSEERYDDTYATAYSMAQMGIPVSQRQSEILNADDIATLNGIANQANQPKVSGGSGSGSAGNVKTGSNSPVLYELTDASGRVVGEYTEANLEDMARNGEVQKIKKGNDVTYISRW